MSFKEVKDDLRDLEAIRDYDRVKKERDDCLASKKDLNEKYDQLVGELGTIREAKATTEQQNRDLQEKLQKCGAAKEQAELEKAALSKEVKELKELKATAEGKTLPEVTAAVIEATNAEIEERSDTRLMEKENDWETKGKPKQVREAAIGLLQVCLRGLAQQVKLVEVDVHQAGIDGEVTLIIDREVKRRLDSEFYKRVETESDEKAKVKVEQLAKVAWPKFVKEQVEPRAMKLESVFRTNLQIFLTNLFHIRCNKCLREQVIPIGPGLVAQLVATGTAQVECSYPDCKDGFGFWRHKMTVTLAALIEGSLGVTSPPGPDQPSPQ